MIKLSTKCLNLVTWSLLFTIASTNGAATNFHNSEFDASYDELQEKLHRSESTMTYGNISSNASTAESQDTGRRGASRTDGENSNQLMPSQPTLNKAELIFSTILNPELLNSKTIRVEKIASLLRRELSLANSVTAQPLPTKFPTIRITEIESNTVLPTIRKRNPSYKPIDVASDAGGKESDHAGLKDDLPKLLKPSRVQLSLPANDTASPPIMFTGFQQENPVLSEIRFQPPSPVRGEQNHSGQTIPFGDTCFEIPTPSIGYCRFRPRIAALLSQYIDRTTDYLLTMGVRHEELKDYCPNDAENAMIHFFADAISSSDGPSSVLSLEAGLRDEEIFFLKPWQPAESRLQEFKHYEELQNVHARCRNLMERFPSEQPTIFSYLSQICENARNYLHVIHSITATTTKRLAFTRKLFLGFTHELWVKEWKDNPTDEEIMSRAHHILRFIVASNSFSQTFTAGRQLNLSCPLKIISSIFELLEEIDAEILDNLNKTMDSFWSERSLAHPEMLLLWATFLIDSINENIHPFPTPKLSLMQLYIGKYQEFQNEWLETDKKLALQNVWNTDHMRGVVEILSMSEDLDSRDRATWFTGDFAKELVDRFEELKKQNKTPKARTQTRPKWDMQVCRTVQMGFADYLKGLPYKLTQIRHLGELNHLNQFYSDLANFTLIAVRAYTFCMSKNYQVIRKLNHKAQSIYFRLQMIKPSKRLYDDDTQKPPIPLPPSPPVQIHTMLYILLRKLKSVSKQEDYELTLSEPVEEERLATYYNGSAIYRQEYLQEFIKRIDKYRDNLTKHSHNTLTTLYNELYRFRGGKDHSDDLNPSEILHTLELEAYFFPCSYKLQYEFYLTTRTDNKSFPTVCHLAWQSHLMGHV